MYKYTVIPILKKKFAKIPVTESLPKLTLRKKKSKSKLST